VAGGVLAQTWAVDATANMIMLKRSLRGDFDVLVDVYMSSAHTGEAGLMFNSSDPGVAGYYLQVDPNNDKFNLWEFPALKLVDHGYVSAYDTWYTIRLQYTLATNTIKARIWPTAGAEPAGWNINTTDATNPHGIIGLYTKYEANFDNLYIDGFTGYYQPMSISPGG
jgi:hypothetical protein